MEDILKITLLSALILFVIGVRLYKHYSTPYILKNSKAINELNKLNSEYISKFHNIDSEHIYICKHKSKSEFDRMNYQHALAEYVEKHCFTIKEELSLYKENRVLAMEYNNQFESIKASFTTSWRFKHFHKLENTLYEKKKITPSLYLQIVIKNIYSSPKGRKYYADSCSFYDADIETTILKIKEKEQFKTEKAIERSKMSDSLRYDILKRDNFKCVICGASAQQGATLHVDHIIPISKGGKTVKNNLRTLCQQCNLGKSNKYDPYGIN